MVGAVIYVRVSTKEQTENLSLPTQLRACEEYCRRQGYEILERFHEEGESAKTTDRSQLQALLKYCRTHKGKVHFVVVYNLTRFAREKYDHFALRAHLKSLGISLRSATEPIDDTSTGKLMEGVLAAFAQFDNDVRSERTRAGMRAALELGRWTFPAPLGYLNAPKWSSTSLVHDPERGPLVRRAFEDLATGQYTKQEVIARATEAGSAQPQGADAIATELRPDDAEPDLHRQGREPGLRRVDEGRLRAARGRGHVLPRPGRARRSRRRRRSASAEPSGLPAARLRALRNLRPAAHRAAGRRAATATTRTTTASASAARSTSARPRSKARSSTNSRSCSRHQATCAWSRIASSTSGSSGGRKRRSGRRSRSGGSRPSSRSSTGSTRRSCTRSRSTSRATSRQRDKLREELTLAQIDHHAEAVDELDVQGILAFAERILPRASDLWVQASLDYKQRLQQLFFPEGIAYDGNRFNRTAVTAPLFNYLAPSESADEKMVSRARNRTDNPQIKSLLLCQLS